MERRAWLCMRMLRVSEHLYPISHLGFLQCMAHNSKERQCLFDFYGNCVVLKIQPNVLIYHQNPEARALRVHMHLHRMFSMNVSITECHLNRPSDIHIYNARDPYLELGSHGSYKEYSGEQLPWSIFRPHSYVKVVFHNLCLSPKCVELEYSIICQMHFIPLYKDTSPLKHNFNWGNFVVRTFHIYVDVINKICLLINSATGNGILAYDSPNPIGRVLLKRKSKFDKQFAINASAFQLFIVVTHCQFCNATTLYYETVEQEKIDIEIRNKPIKLHAKNQSSWEPNSLSWIQTYLLKSQEGHQVDTKILNLKFYCNDVANIFTGGVVLYNIVNGRAERVVGLHKNSDYDALTHLPISFKSTQNVMYVVVYAYTAQCDITTVLEIQAANCAGRYFDFFKLPSTAPFLHEIDHRKYKLHLPYNDRDRCVQFYAWQITENRNYSYNTVDIQITWETNYPVSMEGIITGMTISYSCGIKVYGKMYTNGLKQASDASGMKLYFFGLLKYFNYKACAQLKLTIKMQEAPCDVPCVTIAPKIMTNSVCDICTYLYSTERNQLYLKQNIPLKVYAMKGSCIGLELHVTRCANTKWTQYDYNIDRRPETHTISTKASYRISDKNQCMAYVPKTIAATHPEPTQCSQTPPRLKFIFQSSVHTLMTSHARISWEGAATHCLQTDGTLTVPNNHREYDFIRRSFLESSGIVLIPMGLRRYHVSTYF